MTESMNERYLDQLVIKYILQNIGLTILEETLEQERPKIFLDRIGWDQKKHYFEDTLNAYLTDKLPKGNVYVFSPEDSFKYKNNAQGVENMGIGKSRDGDSTFNDALDDILEIAIKNKADGLPTSANVMFFDRASKDKFETELRRGINGKLMGSNYSSESQQITGYGQPEGNIKVKLFEVTLYQYTIT